MVTKLDRKALIPRNRFVLAKKLMVTKLFHFRRIHPHQFCSSEKINGNKTFSNVG